MVDYIDGYYGHQSVAEKTISTNSSIHLRAKHNFLKIKQEIEKIGKENDKIIEFVGWEFIDSIDKKKFYGLHLLEVLKIDGEVIFPMTNGIKLHHLLSESYLNNPKGFSPVAN
ncbi:hypothetical protein P3602_15065 [Vibrio parahaemolyticus]|uniref:hypothetical protein n=1 Tax=Vibrio parahaemolyticus TaxID=670 RepID=UPI000D73B8CC|nr:hypothetical protein [Vibrio parahaemolyticus]MDF4284041.1 hypothetical protein [Vibrio parahaemolyticus]MDF4965476.1 hypothetical protein [Vibrio parahaemolyticus]MDF5028211.1 hypothetical protein [Vibrio parahaemolyticus]MDF5062457.1 hypothetical protein [Vibrio parahaemolyticus]MDF5087109.1 hypothetical protein [Vibrio parahaemolyticus]